MPGNFAENLLQGIETGQRIGNSYQESKRKRDLQKEMQGLFQDFNSYTEFDAPTALPDAAAAPQASALPIGEANEAVSAATASSQSAPPAALDLGPVKGPKDRAKKPRTQASYDDIRSIQTRIAKIAALSGDPKVLTALQDTFATQVRGRALNHLAEAQQAYESGNTDQMEKALTSMSRLFPATEGMKFKRKDGQLVLKNPLKEGSPEEPVTPETMGLMYQMLSAPESMYALIGTKREAGRKADLEERGRKVDETNAATSATNAQTNAAGEARLKSLVPSTIRSTDANALQSLASARYMDFQRTQGAAGATGGGMKVDDARQFSQAVNEITSATIMSKGMDENGQPTLAPTGLPGYEKATMEDVNRVSGVAEQLGMANPEAGISTALEYAMALDRYARGQPGAPGFNIDTKNGLVGVRDAQGNLVSIFRAPSQLIQRLMAVAAQKQPPRQQAPAAGGALSLPPRTNAQGIPLSIARP